MKNKLHLLLLLFLIRQISFAQEITKQEVINNYLDAIGGVEKLRNLESRVFYQSLHSIIDLGTTKNEVKSKSISVVGKNHETLMVTAIDNKIASKVIFDGEKGQTIMSNGSKYEFDEKMISLYKKTIILVPQISYTSYYSDKVGIEKFDGKDCYVLELNTPMYGGESYKTIEYYSKSSGLLLGGFFENKGVKTTTYFKDYTLFDGILTPTHYISYSDNITSSLYIEKALYNNDINKFLDAKDDFLEQEISFYPSENKHKNVLKNVIKRNSNTNNSISLNESKNNISKKADTLENNIRSKIYKELKKQEKKSSSNVAAISSTINPRAKKFDVQDLVEETGSTLKYRRSSLYTLMINDDERERNSVIKNAFGNTLISEKFNDHNIGPYLVEGTGTSKDKDQTGLIQGYLDENNVAKELVARWFNRDNKGDFNMDLIAERGQYNASDLNSKIANRSKRGEALLKDAGEELIGNTFVIVYDFKYTNKEKQAKKRKGWLNVLSAVADVAGAGDVANVVEGASLASDVLGKGYFVRTTSYLYRLVWDEETANKFYEECWTDKDNHDLNKVKAFDEANFFKLKYLGSEISRSNLQSTIFTSKSDNQLIEISTTKAFDKNIGKLQRTYEEFRVKTPLYKGEPICAKIGLKEGLEPGDKFEVLEQVIDDQGNTNYKRVGKIKVQRGMIWDNTFMANQTKKSKSTKEEKPKKLGFFAKLKKAREEKKQSKNNLKYTVFKGKKGVFASGMLIRQIN